MATIDLGRLGFVNKGTYNNSTTYEKNDLVQFTDGGVLSTYLYIDSTAQSGQAPSSSGTVGSRWVFFAKGVTDSLGGISNNNIVIKDNSGNITGLSGNNKIITTNNSGVPTALSIGAAGKSLKVNSSANGFEFGDGGKVLAFHFTKFTSREVTTGSNSGNGTATNRFITVTPVNSQSYMIVTSFLFGEAADHDHRLRMISSLGGGISDGGTGDTRNSVKIEEGGYNGSDYDSTPGSCHHTCIEHMNGNSSAVTYRWHNAHPNSITLGGSNGSSYEHAASWMTVLEVLQ